MTREAKSCDALTLQAKQTFTLKQKEAQLQTILYIWIEEYFVVHTSKIHSGLGPKNRQPTTTAPSKTRASAQSRPLASRPIPFQGPSSPPTPAPPLQKKYEAVDSGKTREKPINPYSWQSMEDYFLLFLETYRNICLIHDMKG